MATIPVTILVDSTYAGKRHLLFQWPNMGNGDTGEAVGAPMHADKSVQVAGTFGVGGACVIQGSLDDTNYATLNDAQGNALSITEAKIEQILEVVMKIKPVVSGDVNTSLDVTMLLVQGG